MPARSPFNVRRRHALGALGSLGMAGLAGCCSLQVPEDRIPGDPAVGLGGAAFLRPRPGSGLTKRVRWSVDVHAHFFNASDLDVEGYLSGPVMHTLPDTLQRFLQSMLPVVGAIATIAPDAATETASLESRLKSKAWLRADYQKVLDDEISAHRKTVASRLAAAMRRFGVDEEYLQRKRNYLLYIRHPERAAALSSSGLEDALREDLDPAARLRMARGLADEGMPPGPGDDPGDVIEFVGHMLSYRWMSLSTYAKFNTANDGAYGMDGVFGALVDFDYWLCCQPRSSHEDQAKLHSLLSLLSGGYMLPLISYNPWTDLRTDPRTDGPSLELVKRAVRDWGFIGVKLYPPMGYFPWGNEKLKDAVNSDKPRPSDLAALDRRLEDLFVWAMGAGVPVMAHANESMGRDDPSDIFGGPLGWQALLAQFAKRGAPIVNVGHFGGDSPRKDTNHQWPADFAALMGKPEGARFYGDLGYWSALTTCSPTPSKDCRTALDRLDAARKAFPGVGKRIMFGTDWFMSSKEAGWPLYAAQLEQALAPVFPPEDIFFRNAVDCFGLKPGGDNRRRLEARFGGASVVLPDWLRQGA